MPVFVGSNIQKALVTIANKTYTTGISDRNKFDRNIYRFGRLIGFAILKMRWKTLYRQRIVYIKQSDIFGLLFQSYICDVQSIK